MLVLNIGTVIVGVAVMLRATVVAVGRMRNTCHVLFTGCIADETGERGSNALRRQHYERE